MQLCSSLFGLRICGQKGDEVGRMMGFLWGSKAVAENLFSCLLIYELNKRNRILLIDGKFRLAELRIFLEN